jgi:hypothetical protein
VYAVLRIILMFAIEVNSTSVEYSRRALFETCTEVRKRSSTLTVTIVCVEHLSCYVISSAGNFTEEKCVCVQRYLWYGDSGSHRTVKIDSSSFIMIM